MESLKQILIAKLYSLSPLKSNKKQKLDKLVDQCGKVNI